MHTSHSNVSQHQYTQEVYTFSPHIAYNTSNFPFNPYILSMNHTLKHGSSQSFSVPTCQGSSVAESSGSIISEFDLHGYGIKRRKAGPTIATGRRNLKEENVSCEEAEKREKRRDRNRKSAQRCRERKIEKRNALEKQITETFETCNNYIKLAKKVLKAWKERLNVLNKSLTCHNYKSQLSINDFEELIEMIQSRQKQDMEENLHPSEDNNQEATIKYFDLASQMNSTIIEFPKLEPYNSTFTNDHNATIQPHYEQYCLPEVNISYI